MTNSRKKWAIAAIAIAVAVAAGFFFIRTRTFSSQFAGVREITLTPIDVAIPRVELNRVGKATGYVFRQDGEQYHLYFQNNGTLEKVVGKMPTFTENPDLSIWGFAEVVAFNEITTYFLYVKYKALLIEGAKLVTSELYALKGNQVQKVLSNIEPAAINSIDKRIPLGGAYLDERGNLYVVTLDRTLCAIRGGQIIAKVDINTICPNKHAMPSMFSDSDNTYFLVPKLADGKSGPVRESEISAKYRIDLPRE